MTEALEKRVSSRFNHRQVVLHAPLLRPRSDGSAAVPGSTPLAVLSDMLHLPLSGGATPEHDAYALGWNESLRAALDDPVTAQQLAVELTAAPGSQADPSAPPPPPTPLDPFPAQRPRCLCRRTS